MWKASNVFVLSDLHLADEHNKGIFQADNELCNFFKWVKKKVENNSSESFLVVIAGDFLDFLITPEGGIPLEPFSPNNAKIRTKDIIDAHKEVFEQLRSLVSLENLKLVIQSGNHDPELIFPEVQREIENELGHIVHWVVHGEAINICMKDDFRILIEHGDRYDPVNRINYRKLCEEICLYSRGLTEPRDDNYSSPPGSDFVCKHVSKLRKAYSWVEFLKPEDKAVPPILFNFMFLDELWEYKEALLLKWDIKKRELQSLLEGLVDPYTLYKDSVTHIEKTQNWLDKETNWIKEQYALLEEQNLQIKNMKNKMAQKKPVSKKIELIGKLKKISKGSSFFDLFEHDDLFPILQKDISHKNNLVIHGHTHSAKSYLINEALYLNCGTWCQLLELPKPYETDENWLEFLDTLEFNRNNGYMRLTFVWLKKNGENISSELCQWQDKEVVTDSHWIYESKLGCWDKIK